MRDESILDYTTADGQARHLVMARGFGQANGISEEYIGTHIYSDLILAGLTIQQVRDIAMSPALAGDVSRQIRVLCDRFDKGDDRRRRPRGANVGSVRFRERKTQRPPLYLN